MCLEQTLSEVCQKAYKSTGLIWRREQSKVAAFLVHPVYMLQWFCEIPSIFV